MSAKYFLLGVALLAACGNYSNEDLEFMNAIPAAEDITASIPRAIMPANEAELARLTHDTAAVFNGALDFLRAADIIRSYPATSRIPAGRIWGPVPMDDHPGWQWRLVVTRSVATPGRFEYSFDVERSGGGPNDWQGFISGWFVSVSGVRKGTGHFEMRTDALRLAGLTIAPNVSDEMLKELIVDYSTEPFPTTVAMHITMYTNVSAGKFDTAFMIDIAYEAQENGQGTMEFQTTDSAGNTLYVVSLWLATGRGQAAVTVTDGAGTLLGTRTECWNDSFEETYDFTPWAPLNPNLNSGDPASCPDASMATP